MNIRQKDFSQEESDSSNLLLSLMKRIDNILILRFKFLLKIYHQIIRKEHFVD